MNHSLVSSSGPHTQADCDHWSGISVTVVETTGAPVRARPRGINLEYQFCFMSL